MKYIADFEGFFLNRGFVIKEFVLISLDSGEKTHFLLSLPNLSFKILKPKERKSISFCENYLHGIRYRTSGKKISDLKYFLQKTLTSKDTVYIKGIEKVKACLLYTSDAADDL